MEESCLEGEHMKYYLINKAYGLAEQTDFFCTTEEDVIKVIGEDFSYEVINTAFETIEKYPLSVFDEMEVESYIYSHAEDYIRSRKNELVIESQHISDTGEVIKTFKISIENYILNRLEEDQIDCQSNCRVGQYIESCLSLFCDKASWHISIIDLSGNIVDLEETNRPVCDSSNIILWFGVKRFGPQTPWIITNETSDLSFWFERDSWLFLEAISNMEEGTLIWYIYECGNWTPDIDLIRQKCPVSFSASDTGKLVIERVKSLNCYKEG